jgi:hypothetical protein
MVEEYTMSNADAEDDFARILTEEFSSGFEDRIDALVEKVESKEIDNNTLFIEITTICTEFTDSFQRTMSYLIIKKLQTGIDTTRAINMLLETYLAFYDKLATTFDWNRFPVVSPYDKIWDDCYGAVDEDQEK